MFHTRIHKYTNFGTRIFPQSPAYTKNPSPKKKTQNNWKLTILLSEDDPPRHAEFPETLTREFPETQTTITTKSRPLTTPDSANQRRGNRRFRSPKCRSRVRQNRRHFQRRFCRISKFDKIDANSTKKPSTNSFFVPGNAPTTRPTRQPIGVEEIVDFAESNMASRPTHPPKSSRVFANFQRRPNLTKLTRVRQKTSKSWRLVPQRRDRRVSQSATRKMAISESRGNSSVFPENWSRCAIIPDAQGFHPNSHVKVGYVVFIRTKIALARACVCERATHTKGLARGGSVEEDARRERKTVLFVYVLDATIFFVRFFSGGMHCCRFEGIFWDNIHEMDLRLNVQNVWIC